MKPLILAAFLFLSNSKSSIADGKLDGRVVVRRILARSDSGKRRKSSLFLKVHVTTG
ncbi:hypothetical protein KQI74_07315 [Paenibacillus barcinonensis]|jgi:hypothetical protein|uniref:hypothetical protein n=1 Tax=Paenibacillus barcinonensis TaxID=198119 RepID=UPI001C109165|nr:hypothetical protein [Paenibacillus barcinonensis]MBU5352083.1 hypothetical protein [Paenibacillus barcinonensis]